jgi:hypothetical protein
MTDCDLLFREPIEGASLNRLFVCVLLFEFPEQLDFQAFKILKV